MGVTYTYTHSQDSRLQPFVRSIIRINLRPDEYTCVCGFAPQFVVVVGFWCEETISRLQTHTHSMGNKNGPRMDGKL